MLRSLVNGIIMYFRLLEVIYAESATCMKHKLSESTVSTQIHRKVTAMANLRHDTSNNYLSEKCKYETTCYGDASDNHLCLAIFSFVDTYCCYFSCHKLNPPHKHFTLRLEQMQCLIQKDIFVPKTDLLASS